MRREAEAVLRAPPSKRAARLRLARESLGRFILRGLEAHELELFIDRLEANIHGG